MIEHFKKALDLVVAKSFAQSTEGELSALASIEIPSDLLDKGCTWATDTGDSKLLFQLQGINLAVVTARAIALVEMCLRKTSDGNKGKHVTKTQVDALNDLISRHEAFSAFNNIHMISRDGDPDGFHFPIADEMQDASGLKEPLESEAKRLMRALPDVWCTGVTDLVEAVNAFVPPVWEPFKDKVLKTP